MFGLCLACSILYLSCSDVIVCKSCSPAVCATCCSLGQLFGWQVAGDVGQRKSVIDLFSNVLVPTLSNLAPESPVAWDLITA